MAQSIYENSQQLYKQLVHSIDAVVWEAEVQDCRYLFISPQVESMLGYPPAAWLAEPTFWQDHIHPSDRAWVLEQFRRYVAEQQPYQLEYRFIAADGTTVWLRDQITIVVENDRPTKLRGVRIQINGQKRLESLLRRQNAVLEVLVDVGQRLLRTSDLEQRLPEVLAYLGRAVSCSYIYIYQNHQASDGVLLASHRFEWAAATQQTTMNDPQRQEMAYNALGYGRWVRFMQEERPILGHTRDLPESERPLLEACHIYSIIAIPITSGGQWWGFIGCDYRQEEWQWSTIEIEALANVATVLGVALENIHLYESQLIARERAEVLREFAQMASINLEPKAILQYGLQQLRRVLVFDTASIYLNPQGEPAEFMAMAGYNDEGLLLREGWRLQTSPILAQMARDLKPVISANVQHLKGWIWLPGAEHVRSFMAVPLVAHNEMIGALMIDSRQEGFFQEADLHLVEALAQHIGISIENAWLFGTVQRQLGEKTALLAASTAVSSSLDLSTILTRLAEQMGLAIGVTSVHISDWNRDTGFSTVIAEYYAPEALPEERLSDLGMAYAINLYSDAIVTALLRHEATVARLDDMKPGSFEQEHWLRYGAKSVLFVPLVVKDDLVGYAELWESRRRRDFFSQEIDLCQGVANQTAIAIENSRLFAAERQRLRLAQTLQQVGALLTTSLSLQEVYEQIFDLLSQVIVFDRVSLHLLNEEEGRLYLAAARGFRDIEPVRQIVRDITEASLKRVLHPPYWVIISDTHQDSRWIPTPVSWQVRSWIGAALLIKGRLIGILNVDNEVANAYDEEMGETAAAFANQAAVAIENARLYEETHHRANELSILHQVALATATVVTVDVLLQQTTRMIASTLYRDVFGFVLLDEVSQTLVPHDSYQGIAPDFYGKAIPLEKSIVGLVARTGEPVILGDVREEPLYYEGVPSTRSEIAVPLKIHGRVVGVINAESPRVNDFSYSDLRFLVTLAGQVTAAMERAKLYGSLKMQTAELAEQVAARTAELQAERDLTLTILESAGEGILLTDTEANILYINPAMEQQSLYSRDELLHHNPRVLSSKLTPPATYKEMWRTILNKQRWSGELVNQRKDGTLYDVTITITPILGPPPEEAITGFVSVQSDISRLKEVDRLKSRFVSNVSHELRTPLTNIKMYLTLLERGKAERHASYLRVLNLEIDRLTRLIQDLLDLSHLESEIQPDRSTHVNLASVARELFDAFAAKSETKAIRFRLELPPFLPAIVIEERHLGQLLTNLIGNALAYTPDGGEIRVRAGTERETDQLFVWVCVADSGPGISGEDIPRLFERFFRGKLAQDQGVPGTGLGLAICKEIVQRYGGRIEVNSEVGQGAAFTFWLPAVDGGRITDEQ